MRKALVIIPTYNERETLPVAIASVLKYEGFDVLVVDDSSPDGTAALVREMMKTEKRVSLIGRTGKHGLGTAYVEGFAWGLQQGYDYFIEMDADGSHDPAVLPSFIAEMQNGYGLVIGSRYLNSTISVVGWDFHRLMLSKFGNFYASRILGLGTTDLTSGFRCYSRPALESVNLEKIHSNGYAFQIEMAYRVAAEGYRIGEMPIIFYERTSGSSKMSKKIIREAVMLPWRLRLTSFFGATRGRTLGYAGYKIATVVGFLVAITGVVGSLLLGWWLSTEGDIIQIIHQFKMSLPGWVWMAMKAGLSIGFGLIFVAVFMALAIAALAGRRRR